MNLSMFSIANKSSLSNSNGSFLLPHLNKKNKKSMTKCGHSCQSIVVPKIKYDLLQIFHLCHEQLITLLFESFPYVPNHYFEPKKALVEIQRTSNCDYLREVIHQFRKVNIVYHDKPQVLREHNQCTHVFYPGYLPTRYVFKLARLSKAFKVMVESHFYPLRIIDFKKFDETLQFVRLIAQEPNYDRYLELSLLQKIFVKDGHIIFKNVDADQNEQINAMKKAYSNVLYGGSVLGPIKIINDNKFQLLQNRLYQSILFGETSGRDKKYGGCLKLLNVRMSQFHYCDIFIIISSKDISKAQWDILRGWHDHCKSDSFNPNSDPEKNYIDSYKIEKYLTGVARIIYFKKYLTSGNYYLTDVLEGEIHKGVFEGYARAFEVRFNKCKMSAV